MRGTELLDKMALIDEAFVEEAERAPKKKNRIWGKWGAMAACLCLVIASALLIPKTWQTPEIPAPEHSAPEVPKTEESVSQKENTDFTPVVPVQTQPDKTTVDPEPTTEPDDTTTNNGANLFAPDNQEPQNVMPMISGIGEETADLDMAVQNGYAVLSKALQKAMDTYVDTAKYQVFVFLFQDGVQIAADSQLAWNEAERLGDLGYIVALETHSQSDAQGSILSSEHYFTLHATYDQLKDFIAAEHLGYSLMLYNEYFGVPVSPHPGVVYNGSAPCS